MSYTPTVWKTGDVVSSEKLNKIETELSALDEGLASAGSDITDVETALESKANIDGYYESMTVGNAEQLVATVGVEDSVPFNFRTTGGSADVGDRKTMEVVGGTVAFNQKNADYIIPTTSNGITTQRNNGFYSMTGTPSAAWAAAGNVNNGYVTDHVYLMSVYVTKNTTGTAFYWGSLGGAGDNPGISVNCGSTVGMYGKIGKSAITTNGTKPIGVTGLTANADIGTIELWAYTIDLTQMFGSTIADYIYSLEQANAGAGVAWFKKLFPKPYYAYNAGELMSVKTSAYKSVGFNQWDEEWEEGYYGSTGLPSGGFGYIRSKNYISVNPSTSYYCHTGTASNFCLQFYGVNKEFLSQDFNYRDSVVTTPNNCYYLRFWRNEDTYNNDICINLHWDGERDGEYEAYESHTYALDSDLELRGIPKLDADNQLYYDGDIYESDGAVTRRFGIADIGTLTWAKAEQGGQIFFYAGLPNGSRKDTGTCFCSIYPAAKNALEFQDNDKICRQYGSDVWDFSRIGIKDSAYNDSTAAEVKAAMSGVRLVYELATPSEETADPFQTPQIVNDFGTEEFVDARTIPIPVGHNSKYQANLRAKLEMAPNSPSGDGDYIVRQSSGQNTYVPITFPADELPAAPTTDGNYVLKCTVSSGTATFTWEAQT